MVILSPLSPSISPSPSLPPLSLSLPLSLFLPSSDVGRIIPCFRNETGGFPEQCYDPVFNFLLDFDSEKWKDNLSDTGSTAQLLLNISKYVNNPLVANIGILPKQSILYDLPYYYIGK